MSRHKRWINFCVRTATKSKVNTYKHCSCLVKGGKVISLGFNTSKAGCLIDPCYDLKGTHAEAATLHNLKPEQIRNGILYVAGVSSKTKNTILSKPCTYCQEYLSKFQLKAIYFSTPDGQYERLG